MLTIVIYSYLIPPLFFLLLIGKIKEKIPLLLALYGIAFFCLLFFHYLIPKHLIIYYQAFYTFFEYSVFAYIFWFHIRTKFFTLFVAIVSTLFIAFQLFFVTSTTLIRLDSISIGIETIFVFIYIFYFLYEFSKNAKDSFIYNHYCFWISVGILIYLGGSFFFYILINSLETSEIEKFGNLTYIAEIIKNLLFAVSIFFYKKYSATRIQKKPPEIPNLDMV